MKKLTKDQRKTLQKKLPKALAKYLRLAVTMATSKVGIGREFSDKEHLFFAGYLAGFSDAYAQKYNEESCSKFSCTLYKKIRKELYEDGEFTNPLQNIDVYMGIEDFKLGFYAGFSDALDFMEGNNSIIPRGLLLGLQSL